MDRRGLKMKCKYCGHGMMYWTGDECVNVYMCVDVDCESIAIEDVELYRNEYTWYKKDNKI